MRRNPWPSGSARFPNSAGFTLIELIIVMGMIGLLVSIGIPSYRRMVQRAKFSEAKVNLAAVYAAESPFFSEFGTYGTNLREMGMEIGGQASQLTYRTGFMTDTCITVKLLPDPTSSFAPTIQAAMPNYYNCTGPFACMSFGRPSLLGCLGTVFEAQTTTFKAVAIGVVAPGVNKDLPASTTLLDSWSIDEGRNLVHFQDGVR